MRYGKRDVWPKGRCPIDDCLRRKEVAACAATGPTYSRAQVAGQILLWSSYVSARDLSMCASQPRLMLLKDLPSWGRNCPGPSAGAKITKLAPQPRKHGYMMGICQAMTATTGRCRRETCDTAFSICFINLSRFPLCPSSQS